MSERRFTPRVWYRALAAVALAVLAGVVVVQLRASLPTQDLEFLVDASQVPELGDEIVTCQRRLPSIDPEEESDVPDPEPLGRVTSTEVVECPDLFDGQVVTYIGEVVGDVLERDGGAWVLMNDDAYALEVGPIPASGAHAGYNSGLSVWLEGDLRDLVEHPGGPAWRGDVLRVEGVVHRTDEADGGGLTIRARDASVVASAVRLPNTVHWPQVIAAAVLAVFAFVVVLWERSAGRRR